MPDAALDPGFTVAVPAGEPLEADTIPKGWDIVGMSGNDSHDFYDVRPRNA
jgi:hypothetical protein